MIVIVYSFFSLPGKKKKCRAPMHFFGRFQLRKRSVENVNKAFSLCDIDILAQLNDPKFATIVG